MPNKTVNLFGHQVKRGPVIVGVAGIMGLGGWYLYKHATAAQTASAAAPGTEQYGYGSYGYGYGGYGYGQYGYGGFTPTQPGEYYGYGQYGYGFYTTGGQYVGSGFGGGTAPGQVLPPVAATNQQWAQAATQALVGQNFSSTAVATAIGKYLQGKELSVQESNIVTAAIGLEGEPPQAGPGGFPPAVKTQSSSHNPPPAKVRVPNVVGIQYEQAAQILQQVGLVPHRARPDVGIVSSERPKAGTSVKKGSTVTLQGRVPSHKTGGVMPGGRINR